MLKETRCRGRGRFCSALRVPGPGVDAAVCRDVDVLGPGVDMGVRRDTVVSVDGVWASAGGITSSRQRHGGLVLLLMADRKLRLSVSTMPVPGASGSCLACGSAGILVELQGVHPHLNLFAACRVIAISLDSPGHAPLPQSAGSRHLPRPCIEACTPMIWADTDGP